MSNDQEEEHQVETGLPVVTQSAKSSEEKPSLNMKNWLNLLFYIFNVVFTFGVGSLGWFSGQTNGELSLKYQVCVLHANVSVLFGPLATCPPFTRFRFTFLL